MDKEKETLTSPTPERLLLREIFFEHLLMPCCGKPAQFYRGPKGGFSLNIKCCWCGTKFNICKETHYIQKI